MKRVLRLTGLITLSTILFVIPVLASIYADFSSWDYEDTSSKRTITASNVNFDAMLVTDQGWVSDEQSVPATFRHIFEFKITSKNASGAFVGLWAAANSQGCYDEPTEQITINCYTVANPSPDSPRINIDIISSTYGNSSAATTAQIELNTQYWGEAYIDTEIGTYGRAFFNVYSDESCETLVDQSYVNLTENFTNNFPFSYLHVVQGYGGDSGTSHITGYVKDLVCSEQGSAPIYYDDETEDWEEADENEDTGLYEYWDGEGKHYVWIDDEWVYVSDTDDETMDVISGDFTNSINNMAEVVGCNNSAGHWFLTLAFMGIAYLLFSKVPYVKWVAPLLIFGISLAVGWIELWVILLLAIVAGGIFGISFIRKTRGA